MNPRYQVLYDLLPLLPADARWTEDERARWLDVFETCLNYLVTTEEETQPALPFPPAPEEGTP